MTLSAARLLWGLAILLAAGVAAELARPDAKVPVPPPAAVTAPTSPPNAAEPVGPWVTAVLARPLFSPDRRPDPPAAQAAHAASTRPEPPRLAGILLTPQGGRAIFAAAGEDGPAIVAGEGAHVGNWQVEAIRAGEVQLGGPDGHRTVRPSYSDKPPAAVAPPAPRPLLPPAAGPSPFAVGLQPSGAAILGSALPPNAVRVPR